MKRTSLLLIIFCLFPLSLNSNDSVVDVIRISGIINPVSKDFIINSIEEAEEKNAECIIIELDTPGGLMKSMKLIIKKIFSSEIPVIVYISPGGSTSGSAGVFITLAAHIAAMAPGTNIGAAHPVQWG